MAPSTWLGIVSSAAANCGDRLTVVHAHSSEARLPEGADLVVSDQIGRFGFDAGLLSMLRDARVQMLRADARYLPAALTLADFDGDARPDLAIANPETSSVTLLKVARTIQPCPGASVSIVTLFAGMEPLATL